MLYTHICTTEITPMRETPDPGADRVSELTWAEPVALVTGVPEHKGWVLVYGAHYDLPGWVDQKHIGSAGNEQETDADAWAERVAAPYSKDVLDLARSLFLERNTPYLWGGITPAGVDCSGLVHACYRLAHGRLIPRDAVQQEHYGTPVLWDDLQPGDLITYGPTDPTDARTTTHDALYTGSGHILHSTGRDNGHGQKLGVVEEPEPQSLKAMRRLAVRI